jgi:hypothetical protein
MLSARYLLIPFALQLLCMAVDELYFHRRRGLPPWERWGHPLDTLTVLACLGWLLAQPPNQFSLNVYAALSVFSCLFVTKDEWVHRQACTPAEHWLHALLFLSHPLALLGAGLLWPAAHGKSLPLIRAEGFERAVLLGQTLLTAGCGLYQLIYWNFAWPSRPPQTKSTTTSTRS